MTDAYPNTSQFNAGVAAYNSAVNKAVTLLYGKDPELVKRVLVVNGLGTNGDIFDPTDAGQKAKYYQPDGITLSRAGENFLTLLLVRNGWPTMSMNANGANINYTDYSATFPDAQPVEWADTGVKSGGELTVSAVREGNDDAGASPQTSTKLVDLAVKVPDGQSGDAVSWKLDFPDRGQQITGTAALNASGAFSIAGVGLGWNGNQLAGNRFVLKVFGKDGKAYEAYEGADLGAATATSAPPAKAAAGTLTAAQQKFMSRFEDKSNPMTWVFLGDSTEHGALFNVGFDVIADVAEKSVRQDWGRPGDVFINAAMSGDFSNRQVDPSQLESRIGKYAADVVSITLGVSDGIDAKSYFVEKGDPTYGVGYQRSLTTEEQFKANFRTIARTVHEANPDAVFVVNAITPTNYNQNGQDRTQVPQTYNAYLNELFGTDPNRTQTDKDEFGAYVIWNPTSYDALKGVVQDYPYLWKSDGFFGSDSLHPSANAHLVKAKTFLDALGIDTANSYLGDYMLQMGEPAPSDGKILVSGQAVPSVTIAGPASGGFSPAYYVPNLTNWTASVKKLAGPNKAIDVGQVFLTLTGQTTGRKYMLQTNYGDNGNNYVLPYLPADNYTVSAYASLTASIGGAGSGNQLSQYYIKAADGTQTIPA